MQLAIESKFEIGDTVLVALSQYNKLVLVRAKITDIFVKRNFETDSFVIVYDVESESKSPKVFQKFSTLEQFIYKDNEEEVSK